MSSGADQNHREPGLLGTDTLQGVFDAHGMEAVEFNRITTGKFNESWFVTLDNGRELVLRIAPPDDAGFIFYERRMMAQEPGLHRVIREKTSIPVAEILIHDDSRDLIDRDYLIMTRLPGRALSDTHLSSSAADSAMEDTGRFLRELHDNCRAERCGYLGEHHPMEPCDTWVDAFHKMWLLLINDIRACGVYDAGEAKAAGDALLPYLRLFDRDIPSSLLHMDVWGQNILVDDTGRVTGLVDWDRALWGDVEIEFAVLDYCGISTAAFWRGYGRERDDSEAAAIRGVFYYLYELQKYIVIRMLRSRSPQQAMSYKVHAARILSRLTG